VLHAFNELLASLIGRALSERLLDPVAPRPPGHGDHQDIPR
jgi:hypothetical protein